VDAWGRALPDSFLRSDIFHLHHLTPLHEAVHRLRPDAPIVAHLHGTELKFLQALPAMPESVAPYAAFWSDRLRTSAAMCRRLVVGSPTDKVSASALLGVEPDRIDIVPGGVDTDSFRPQVLGDAERLAMFRRWLVDDPQGWDESCLPGSIRYSDDELRGLLDPSTGEMRPVVLFVGRFTAVKRIPLLLRAWSRARRRFAGPAALVVWGGHPGEFEDEHPGALARRLGLDDVFFLGWRGHDELPSGLAASDLLVLPSVNESFGLVAIEAMATGIPVIATRSGGPPSFINIDPEAPTGWLVEPDDEAELADAMVEAVNQPDDRRRRGDRSLIAARTGYSWTAIAARFEAIYARLLEDFEPT
jgi:glycosyltransferase involved in cell wall biosynthesis